MNLFGLNILGKQQLHNVVAKEVQRQAGHKYERSQVRRGESDYSGPFSTFHSTSAEIRTFKHMRNILPFLDATVLKRTLLIGDFDIIGEDDATTEFLNNYKRNVRENYFGRGYINFLYQHADSTLATGIGLSERVNREDMSGTFQLLNGDPANIRFIKDEERGYVLGYQHIGMTQPRPFENPEFIYYTAFDKRYGSPKGYSIFHGLEFVTQLQSRIMQALHNYTWRMGDPIYIGIAKGDAEDDGTDIGPSKVSNNFKTQLKDVMQLRSKGQTGDMHLYMPGGYDFQVQALGVDGMPAFDYTINSRLAIEQLIVKTHLPPYAFGLYQWNSNYRMSTDQQKMLIAAIESDRRKLEPIIYRDFEMELFYSGRRQKFYIEWRDVDLSDIIDNARSVHLNAAAKKAIAETQVNVLWMNGVIDDDQLLDALEIYELIPENTNKQKVLDSLGNIRKLALLKNVSNQVLSGQVQKALSQ